MAFVKVARDFDHALVNVDAATRVDSNAAYETLLSRSVTLNARARNACTAMFFQAPVAENDSQLRRDLPDLRAEGFRPLAMLVERLWFGSEIGIEIWVDSTGEVVLETLAPTTGTAFQASGRRTISTYFQDGTSLVMWHDGLFLDKLASPSRENMASSGNLLRDLDDFRTRVAELVRGGKRVLHVWDAGSLIRRSELHDRYMWAKGSVDAGLMMLVGKLGTRAIGLAIVAGILSAMGARALASVAGLAIGQLLIAIGWHFGLPRPRLRCDAEPA